MEYLIQLNDGPLDGVELNVEGNVARRLHTITLDVVRPCDVDDIGEAEVESAAYDRYVDEPTANSDEATLCFYYDRSTIVPKHPLAKIHHRMPDRDKSYWNEWVKDIDDALDACFEHVDPDHRQSNKAIKAYEKARRRIGEVPHLRTAL